jgi:uncharacterized membrane protein
MLMETQMQRELRGSLSVKSILKQSPPSHNTLQYVSLSMHLLVCCMANLKHPPSRNTLQYVSLSMHLLVCCMANLKHPPSHNTLQYVSQCQLVRSCC